MGEIPIPATERLMSLLKAHGKFRDVDHAQFHPPDAEPERQANVLKFIYRTLPYHAHVGREEIQIVRPGKHAKDCPVGKPIPVFTERLAELVAKTIDDAKLE